MSKPKNMTPEQEAKWLEKECARRAAYREANRERLAQQSREWRANNKDKYRERMRIYLEANPEKKAKRNAATLEWMKKNREHVNAVTRKRFSDNPDKYAARKAKENERRKAHPDKEKARAKKYSENLSDGYVASTLGMKVNELPSELLDLKRQQLQLIRLTKQLEKEIENVE